VTCPIKTCGWVLCTAYAFFLI